MPIVRIRIYRGKSFDDKALVHTLCVETNSDKSLTSKKAGQILANNFPAFDTLTNRNGLQKTNDGFRAMRTISPTEKCDYHYIWEYAFVTEEDK